MRRVFIQEVKLGKQPLSPANHKYLKKVLRLASNEQILVFDGKKQGSAILYENTIEISEIQTIHEVNNNKKLFIPIIKKDRFEWMIEKITEIGIKEIWIIQTERTQNNFNLQRIEAIAQAALKQSGQISMPMIVLTNFDEFIKQFKNSNIAYASLNGQTESIGAIEGIAIGPEGGWSAREEQLLSENNFSPIKLTSTVLRTETAAICCALKLVT